MIKQGNNSVNLKPLYEKGLATATLKTLDTIGSCRRLVFSLGVSWHMLKVINL